MQKKDLRNIVIILIILLVLELTIFNINSYRVLNSKNSVTFGKDDFQYVENDEGITYIQIHNINREIKTVHIEVKNMEYVPYEFLYTDETSQSLQNTPSKMYIQSLENSKYIATYLSGKTDTIAIKLDGENIDLKSVTINEKIPMNFSLPRVTFLFIVAFFIYSMRNFEIFKKPFSNRNIKQEFILLGILAIFLVLTCFINDNSKDESKKDFYSYNFVKALSNNSVSLEEIPNQNLQDMENPYDTDQRYSYDVKRDKDYFWDTAFYDGKAYVYFGILPVITLFLPYHLITGDYLLSAVGVLLFSVLAAIAIKALVEIVFTRFFKEIEFKFVVLTLLIMLFGSQILILNGIPRFYEVPIASGIFFAITGLDFILMAIYGKKVSYIKMFVGSLCLALAVACRPTELFASLIVLPILIRQFIKNIKDRKNIVKNILAVAIPYLTVGILLMYYNYIRFGSVFEFGAKYQLTIHDMYHLSNRLATIWTGLICSLFSVPNFLPNFPFITNHNNLATFYGYYYIENMIGGLFIMVPVCFGILKLPVVFKKSENRDLVRFILSLVIVGFLICFLSIIEAGSMQRYIVDYGWMLALAGICTLLELRNIYKTDEAKHILKKIVAVLTIYIVIINILGGIVSEKSYLRVKSPEKYYEIKYTVDFWE